MYVNLETYWLQKWEFRLRIYTMYNIWNIGTGGKLKVHLYVPYSHIYLQKVENDLNNLIIMLAIYFAVDFL